MRFQKTSDPLQLVIDGGGPAANTAFVFPVRRDTVFGCIMHIPGADLNLKRDTVGSDHGGVKGLIHVLFRRGNIIFETSGDGIEQIVDQSQNEITVIRAVNDDAKRVNIVDLLKRAVLRKEFPVNTENMFDAVFQRKPDIILPQFIADQTQGIFDKSAGFPLSFYIRQDRDKEARCPPARF